LRHTRSSDPNYTANNGKVSRHSVLCCHQLGGAIQVQRRFQRFPGTDNPSLF